MTDMTIKVEFKAPSKDSPGYLKRMRRAIEFGSILKSGEATPELLDNLVNFLANYVTEPQGDAAITALWELTEEQFLQLIDVVKGGSGNAVPPTNAVP
jgi:hypothetical protein